MCICVGEGGTVLKFDRHQARERLLTLCPSTPAQFELRSRRQPNTSDLTNLDISFQSDITYRFANYVPT